MTGSLRPDLAFIGIRCAEAWTSSKIQMNNSQKLETLEALDSTSLKRKEEE